MPFQTVSPPSSGCPLGYPLLADGLASQTLGHAWVKPLLGSASGLSCVGGNPGSDA